MAFFFLWFLTGVSPTVLTDMGFEKLTPALVQVSSTGEIFILDKRESQIVKYDATGKLIQRISRKGRGPNELLRPGRFYLRGDVLYVSDWFNQSVKAFDFEGGLIQSWKNDFRKLNMVKMARGWLYLQEREGTTSKLMLGSDNLEKKQTVFEWEPRLVAPPIHHRGLPKVARMNPVREHTLFAVEATGRFAFIGHTGRHFKVTVIDAVAGTTSAIEREFPKIPFNEEWGLRTIADSQQPGQKQAFKMKLAGAKYFPMLRSMTASPEGHVVVRRWLGNPDLAEGYHCFDVQGNPVELPYNPAHLHRILAVRGDIAYVSGFDVASDSATILKTPLKKVDRVIRANPIPADPPKPMWISLK